MNQVLAKFHNKDLSNLWHSFTPASRAAIILGIPFTVIDSIHYYTAGTALVFSLPLLALIYGLCGIFAARFARQEGQELGRLPSSGRSAGLRLWLTSTVINILLVISLGIPTLGVTLLSGAVYVCLFTPLHASGSALVGWLGGWLCQQYYIRITDR